MAKKIVETPLMLQYAEMKAKHPDAVLLFRVGDFYESFSDDAIVASEILGITLTRRANGAAQFVELAGFPHHALDSYLPKLVRAGKRVAICEQLEDPKLAKKLVKRGITELVTPGVTMSDTVLSSKENNFLGAVHFGKGGLTGIAFLDISTGEFFAAQGNADYADKVLTSMLPKEVVLQRGCKEMMHNTFSRSFLCFELDDWIFTEQSAVERLTKQFGTTSLKGFGIDSLHCAVIAAGAILHYLDITSHTRTSHITSISRIDEDKYVRMDNFTVRNLELTEPLTPDGRSLLDVIDRTVSPMGGRMLRKWLAFPLKDPKEINERLDVVEHFFRCPDCRDEIVEEIRKIGDLERLVSKIATERILPREVVQVRNALDAVAKLKELTAQTGMSRLQALADDIDPCTALIQHISKQVRDDATLLGRGEVFNDGIDDELDRLRAIAFRGRDYLAAMQAREIESTGIPSLKIGYNNIFGYYIEVTNTHKNKVPADWVRKQTLVNAERYITPELKDYEEQILTAQEKVKDIEARLYGDLIKVLSSYMPAMKHDASLVAWLDVLCAFTEVSACYKYNRPIVDDSLTLKLTAARHPVIERQLPPGEPYISNSIELSNDGTQIMMITGPNMSGKSALLRQTALNVILAQTGCFVAADSAHIGVVDKIFTRVGASDNISLGESTFMVEMNEAASILNNMSARSLILFDELGRGTSTYDGISIAWAIVEYIHDHGNKHPKTLFATHYHELNDMEGLYSRIANYNVSVKEIDGKVVFLRKLERGGSEHSFGIHVAKLAGMPNAITKRAAEILKELERKAAQTGDPAKPRITMPAAQITEGVQMSFFGIDDPVLEQIRDQLLNIDIDNLTPLEALTKLSDIRKILLG